jgi:hypothetical protein
MGVILSSIPYKSQYDPDADEGRNDCGPASIAMLLHGFGINASTNAVFRKTGAKSNQYVSIGQLMRAATSYGIAFDYFYNWSIPQLIDGLQRGKAIMTLVHYGAWSQINPGISTQNPFKGPHFVAVIGADEENIYVNDPLWTGVRRGDGFRRAWTHAEFFEAWSSNDLDGNRDCSGIISQRSIATEPYGSGTWTPVPEVLLDPRIVNRIRAWVLFLGGTEPKLDNPASVNSYKVAMAGWGSRIARHTIGENDDLGTVALRYYGDPLKWQVILAFNGLRSGDTIADGDTLFIPEPLEVPLTINEQNRPWGSTSLHRLWLEKEKMGQGA